MSFQSLAGRITCAVVVEGDEAVLLGGDGHRDDRLPAGPASGLHQRLPPRLRVLLAAGRERGGMGGAAGPDELAGVGVADLDFRRLGGRVHPEDECHQPPASPGFATETVKHVSGRGLVAV